MSLLQLQPGENKLILDVYASQILVGAWFELPYPPVASLVWQGAIDLGTVGALNINLENQINPADPTAAAIVLSSITSPTAAMNAAFARVTPGAFPLVRANITQITVATGTPRIRIWVRV